MSPDRSLRLLIVTGTRADFGLWHEVIAEAERRPSQVGVRLLVSGMHLDERFGDTIAEIRASGTPIAAEIPFTAPGDSRLEMAASMGQALTGFAPAIDAEAPDWLLLLGDRGEQLAAALVGVHLGLPIAHLHGGERTLGAVDDTLRDMISRAAHLHLVATGDAAGASTGPYTRVPVVSLAGFVRASASTGSTTARTYRLMPFTPSRILQSCCHGWHVVAVAAASAFAVLPGGASARSARPSLAPPEVSSARPATSGVAAA